MKSDANNLEFSQIITHERKKKFKFPKTFHNQANLSCTYLHYLYIERGQKHPTSTLAAEILKALGCDVRMGIYAWARDQFDSEELKGLFRPSIHQLKRSKKTGEGALAVNRMQGNLLRKSPIYWEILTFMNAYSQALDLSDEIVARKCKLPIKEAREYLQELYENALIDREENGLYKIKEWLFIPYNDEFKDIRDGNFQRAYERFKTSKEGWRFRTTHTRIVTPEQKEAMQQKIFTLLDEITDMPDNEEGRAVTLGVFASDRSFETI